MKRSELLNSKIYVNGKSCKVQEKLFRFGFEWASGNPSIGNVAYPFIYIDNNGMMSFGSNMVNFNDMEHKEVSAEKILSEKVTPECRFKPYDRVLVRDMGQCWYPSFFGFEQKKGAFNYVCLGIRWRECIAYEGNEYLVGTDKDPEGKE